MNPNLFSQIPESSKRNPKRFALTLALQLVSKRQSETPEGGVLSKILITLLLTVVAISGASLVFTYGIIGKVDKKAEENAAKGNLPTREKREPFRTPSAPNPLATDTPQIQPKKNKLNQSNTQTPNQTKSHTKLPLVNTFNLKLNNLYPQNTQFQFKLTPTTANENALREVIQDTCSKSLFPTIIFTGHMSLKHFINSSPQLRKDNKINLSNISYRKVKYQFINPILNKNKYPSKRLFAITSNAYVDTITASIGKPAKVSYAVNVKSLCP